MGRIGRLTTLLLRLIFYLIVQEFLKFFEGDQSISVFVKNIKLLYELSLSLVKLSLLLDLSFFCVDIAKSVFEFLVGISSTVSLAGNTSGTSKTSCVCSRLPSGLRSWRGSWWDQEVQVHICLFRRELNYLN